VTSPDTILVVDDEYAIVESLVDILNSEGFEVLTAANGKQALDVFTTKVPELVLMDLMMPVMDGAQLFRTMEKRGLLEKVAVVFMTAAPMALPKDLPKSVSVLVKPFDISDLLKVIRAAIGAKR
jgi:CheY-like chemotaxis protein